MNKLEGRHAVVTGAGRGIGRAIAAGLAEEGALVTLVARSREPLDDLASEIQTNGGQASVAAADVSTPEGVASIASPPDWPRSGSWSTPPACSGPCNSSRNRTWSSGWPPSVPTSSPCT